MFEYWMGAIEKILDCKELTWLCSGCSKEVMEIDRVKNRDDRLVEMMSAFLEKITGMELALSQKADIGVVEEFEERVKAMEEKLESECRKTKRQEVANDHEGELHEVETVASRSEEEKRLRKEKGIQRTWRREREMICRL